MMIMRRSGRYHDPHVIKAYTTEGPGKGCGAFNEYNLLSLPVVTRRPSGRHHHGR